MANIIDLDFYRKFRVILPMHSSSIRGNKACEDPENRLKPYHRRRRTSYLTSKLKNRKEDGSV